MTLYRRLPTPEATKQTFSQAIPYLNLMQVEAIAKQRDETQ